VQLESESQRSVGECFAVLSAVIWSKMLAKYILFHDFCDYDMYLLKTCIC
jgi:hypothetical protein